MIEHRQFGADPGFQSGLEDSIIEFHIFAGIKSLVVIADFGKHALSVQRTRASRVYRSFVLHVVNSGIGAVSKRRRSHVGDNGLKRAVSRHSQRLRTAQTITARTLEQSDSVAQHRRVCDDAMAINEKYVFTSRSSSTDISSRA